MAHPGSAQTLFWSQLKGWLLPLPFLLTTQDFPCPSGLASLMPSERKTVKWQ